MLGRVRDVLLRMRRDRARITVAGGRPPRGCLADLPLPEPRCPAARRPGRSGGHRPTVAGLPPHGLRPAAATAIWLGVTAAVVWRAITVGAPWWDFAAIAFIALVGFVLITLGC
jgi:hypothetical protein